MYIPGNLIKFLVQIQKLAEILKIRYVLMCYALEALLLNLNYKFDKVSGDIHVQILNHYRCKDKLKLSLNFRLAATQKNIGNLFKINKDIYIILRTRPSY